MSSFLSEWERWRPEGVDLKGFGLYRRGWSATYPSSIIQQGLLYVET